MVKREWLSKRLIPLATLFLLTLPTTADTAGISGSTCYKKNISAVSSGVIYKCVTKGKYLIWQAEKIKIGLKPVISEVLNLDGILTIRVKNFDPLFFWKVEAGPGVLATITKSGVISIQVSVDVPSFFITLSSERDGYKKVESKLNIINTLHKIEPTLPVVLKDFKPIFGVAQPTNDGFELQILNFSPDFNWKARSSAEGIVVISNLGLVSVSGLPRAFSSTVTVSTEQADYLTSSVTSPPITSRTSLGIHTIGNLLWSDEFNGKIGSGPDIGSWTSRKCGKSAANGGGTCHNNESQSYLPTANVADGFGNMVITATRATPEPGTCLGSTCAFTSGRFDTQGKVSFKYGYIEARIKMPTGLGNWPAFWMLSNSITERGWPYSGEIDIAEQWLDQPTRNSGAVHYSMSALANPTHTYDYGENYSSEPYSLKYHTYAIVWQPTEISLYVDDTLFLREVKSGSSTCNGPANPTKTDCRSKAPAYWPFDEPFFLIFNNAISEQTAGKNIYQIGSWTTSSMNIDYVRAYQVDGLGSVILK